MGREYKMIGREEKGMKGLYHAGEGEKRRERGMISTLHLRISSIYKVPPIIIIFI